MDDQRHAAALTDDGLEREIARALAVDPSPEFLARVRMQIANEPRPTGWPLSWMLATCALVGAAVVVAVIVNRADVTVTPDAPPLAARAIAGNISIPIPAVSYVGSGFSRTYVGPPEGGPHVRIDIPPAGTSHEEVLLDPRETQALRALLAGARANRLDLSPLWTSTPAASPEVAAASDLVIHPIAIEPLAPIAGAQDPISRDSASPGQGERQ